MKNLSVSAFIHILFSLAFLILLLTFVLFNSWDEDRRKIAKFNRYQLVAITFLSNLRLNPDKKRLAKLYRDLQLRPVDEKGFEKVKKEIESKGVTVFSSGSLIGRVRVFRVGEKYYFYVQRMQYNLLLEDIRAKDYNFQIALGLGIFLIALLLLLYFAILRKLSPLKRLHRQIQRFAQGDMQVHIDYAYDDEIGKIAKSFDDAIVRINRLSQSKNLFMRNLMHELKTPITKGRIAVEMVEDAAIKKVLVRAFDRMNELINELAEIERLSLQHFEPDFEYVMLSEIVQEALELLIGPSERIKVEIRDIPLTTDKKLMALALKNLLDNGIKYGGGAPVILRNHAKTIEVVSQGEALEHPLEYYTEPFSQAEKRSSGFGLGLYIVHTILQKIGYSLSYRHEAGENIFALVPSKR